MKFPRKFCRLDAHKKSDLQPIAAGPLSYIIKKGVMLLL